MTEAERIEEPEFRMLELTVELWNIFIAQDRIHPTESQEFCSAIHAVQDKIAYRVASKARPDLFPNKMNDKSNG